MATTKKYIVEIDAETGELVSKVAAGKKEIEGLNKSTKDTTDTFSEFGNVADKVTGGLVSGAQEALGSVKGLSLGFKTLRGAIISTGIGALVVALGALANWLTTSEKGARMLDRATIGLQVVMKKLSDTVNDLIESDIPAVFDDPIGSITEFGESIQNYILDNVNKMMEGFGLLGEAVQKLFEGDFSGAMDAAAEGSLKLLDSTTRLNPVTAGFRIQMDLLADVVTETGEAIEEADRQAVKMEATMTALREAEKRLVVENARLSGGIEVQQKIIDDTTRSFEERSEALDKQSAMTLQLAKNEAELARLREQSLRDQISITANINERRELEQELADAQAERIEKESQIMLIELENEQKRREIDIEEFERRKAIADQLEQLRLEQIQDEAIRAMEELRIAEKQALDELKLLRGTEEEKEAVREEYRKLREQKEKEFAEKEKQAEREKQAAILGIIASSAIEGQMQEQERLIAQLEKEEEEKVAELERLGAKESEIAQVKANFAQKRDNLNREFTEKEIEYERQVQEAKINLAMQGAQALTGLIEAFGGESERNAKRVFNINKALGIADAVINTARAIGKALAETTDPTPTQSLRFANAAIAGALGVAQVAKIASTRFQSSGGGGGGGAPSLSAPGGNLQPTGAPQIPQAPVQNENSIRAFVVEKNVTTAQSQNQKINEQALLTQ